MKNIFEQQSEKGTDLYNTEKNKKEKEKSDDDFIMTRRSFIKTMTVAGAGCLMPELVGKDAEFKDDPEELSEFFWQSIIEKISRNIGEEPSPQEIRSYLITKILHIPQGRTSGLWTKNKENANNEKETIRIEPELDKMIAENFTNITIKMFDTEHGPITSSDPRDFNDVEEKLEEFRLGSEDLKVGKEKALQVYRIIKKEVEYFKNLPEDKRKDEGIELVWLPGGVPLVMRGYIHTSGWQKDHGEHLSDTYAEADYIAIEGFHNITFGDSLDIRWSDKKNQFGHYSRLMKDLVLNGFDGHFLEIDARDQAKVMLDSYLDENKDPKLIKLPQEFYQYLFDYLKKENSRFIEKVDSVENLKSIAIKQSFSDEGIIKRRNGINTQSKKKCYSETPLVDSTDYSISTMPTGMELGQMAFTDALAAIKLHKLAQDMNDKIIEKGLIVDFEGALHLPLKSFFIKYPQYAVEVVLRNIHELMAGEAGDELSRREENHGENRSENLKKVYEFFKTQDYQVILKKISEIPMFHVEKDNNKGVEIGSNQKKLIREEPINCFDQIDEDLLNALYDDKYIQAEIDNWKSKQTNL